MTDTTFDARLFDAAAPLGRPVRIRATPAGLVVDGDDGATWSYGEIQPLRPASGEPVRIERAGHAEVLVCPDHGVLAAIRAVAPEHARRFASSSGPSFGMRVLILAAAALALAVAAIQWGIPALATALARRVPVEWERQFGETVMRDLTRTGRIVDPRVTAPVEAIVARLAAALPGRAYSYRVVVIDRAEVNAFAAPGGFIGVHRGLIEFARTPEELAGVLAHEMIHVEKRHTTEGIFKQASLGVLVALLAGDPSGQAGPLLEIARGLGDLSYSRAAERDADEQGLRLLAAAGVDPGTMPEMLDHLATQGGQGFAIEFLSTHPAPQGRAERLRAMLATVSFRSGAPLMSEAAWRDLRAAAATRRDTSRSR